jgi:alkanesulfonate monooxygenase SsuD/methylene tetrahydromethanopterin reductase-like flavin-dependent oxidoreductase (luciferase family)
MIDILSGGRLVAGFPRGVPQNFAAYGADPEHSRERLAEAIDFVLKAWTHRGPFDWNGAHYQFHNVSIWPQPTALPEMVLSSKSPESVALAVKHRAVMAEIYVKNHRFLEHFIRNREVYRQAAASAGWDAGDDRFLVSVPCIIAPTYADAVARADAASRYVSDYISGSFEAEKGVLRETYYGEAGHLLAPRRETVDERIAYGGLICGDAASVIDQIQALHAQTGAGVLGLQMQWGNLPPDAVRQSLDLFARHVRGRIA